jgi:hypothetical protein
MKKITFIIVSFLLLTSKSFSEEENSAADKKIRPALQVGFPNFAGLNVEYLIHGVNDRLAVDFSFGFATIPLSEVSIDEATADVNVTWTNWNFGARYYLLKKGEGFYVGASYGQIGATADIDNIKGSINQTINGVETGPVDVSGTTAEVSDVSVGLIGINLGWTWISESGFTTGLDLGIMIPSVDDISYRFENENTPIPVAVDTFVYEDSEYGFPVLPKLQFRIGYAF